MYYRKLSNTTIHYVEQMEVVNQVTTTLFPYHSI